MYENVYYNGRNYRHLDRSSIAFVHPLQKWANERIRNILNTFISPISLCEDIKLMYLTEKGVVRTMINEVSLFNIRTNNENRKF